MRHLRTFEDTQYTDIIKNYIDDYFNKINIKSDISKLNIRDFMMYDFSYNILFSNLIMCKTDYNGKGNDNYNIFYMLDVFVNEKNTPKPRELIYDIINNIYVENNLEKLFDEKLIELLKTSITNYTDFYNRNVKYLSDNVKKELRFYVDLEKYNL